MRHVSAALVAAAVVAGSASAQGPPVSLVVDVTHSVVPSGHHFLVALEGSIPEGSEQLWAFVRRGRVLCSGVPYEEQGTPIVSGTTFQGNFLVRTLIQRRELGPYTVCGYLGYTTARAVFRIGPPELRTISLGLTAQRGKSARRPGATVFRLRGSRQARADLRVRWQGNTVSRVRARLGRHGARSLRVPWSCARAGQARYALLVRDRYGDRRSRTGSFRTQSCVGLRGFFAWPLRGRITSPFGYAERGRLHDGIDIDDNRSSVIHAAAWGRVTSAGWSDGFGLMTVIDHGEGFITFYGHQSRILVHSGRLVRRGQAIGHVGCTGSCTGTHLHFGLHVRGAAVNPLRYLWR